MNLLTDGAPEFVIINGKRYDICTDFRASIQFELVIMDEDKTDEEKVLESLLLHFPDGIPDEPAEDIFRAILWFHGCGEKGKRKEKEEEEEDDETAEPEPPAFSYEYDDGLIYAAFLAQYGVDLTTADLHWWKFRAMFEGLDPESTLAKIMYYRTAKITGDMGRKERDFLQRMKRLHALPLSDKQQAIQDALADALLHGGDVSAILQGQTPAETEKEYETDDDE